MPLAAGNASASVSPAPWPNPRLIVADEPVSALDVSVQAQVLNLLMDLQDELGLTYLFVSHDLSVVNQISNTVLVMYVGRVAEIGPPQELFASPKHPYTAALLSSLPKPDPFQRRERIIPEGEVANPANPPSGCYFHPRCPFAIERCRQEAPPWRGSHPAALRVVTGPGSLIFRFEWCRLDSRCATRA